MTDRRSVKQGHHPFRRRLAMKFPAPLSRRCGYPGCGNRLTVDLFAPESDFRSAEYCPGHGELANRRRRQLKTAIREIDTYLDGSVPLPRAPTGNPEGGLTRAELKRWRLRLQWEVDGIPNS
ncbi:MAG: hypothetical protein H0U53_08575 [Actinobacteria bacterium]|nr:hypothetical protein [Actinomycetota bacterium]